MTNKPTIDGVSRELIEGCALHLEWYGDQAATDRAKDLRALLDADIPASVEPTNDLREHCKQCAEVVKTWPEWKRDCLGGAPVVERQPMEDDVQMASMPVDRCYDVRAKMIIAFNESKKAGGDLDDALDASYRSALRFSPAPQDFAAPQSTIAQLQAENARIKSRLCACRDCGGQGEVYSGHDSYQGHLQPPEPNMDVCGTCGGYGVLGPLEDFESLAAERGQLQGRIAELESARGEPVAWLAEAVGSDGTAYRRTSSTTQITMRDVNYAWGERVVSKYEIKIQPLFTAPPAPVAAVLTDEQILEAMRPSIYAADGGYVFDTEKPHVVAAGRALIACLDATAALNGERK